MKKIIALLICGSVILGIAGCGNQTAEVQEETETSDTAAEETEPAEKRDGLDGIKKTGKLVVCTSPDYAPFEFVDSSREGTDQYVGADMELAGYLAEQLGVELEIRAMEFDECLEAVSANEADLGLMGMLPEKERESLVEFTDVYYNEGTQSMLVLKDRLEEFPDMESFAGMTVAAQNGTVQAQLVVEQLPESYLEVAASVDAALPMLRSKMADGIAVPTVVGEKLVKENTDLALMKEQFEYESQGLAGCVPPGESELLKELNGLIAEVVDSGIYYEWMDEAYKLAAYLNIR